MKITINKDKNEKTRFKNFFIIGSCWGFRN